jgi:prophage tail gpP-like protein
MARPGSTRSARDVQSVLGGRVSLTVAGQVYRRWTEMEVTRDLRDIAGGFELRLIDSGRAAQAARQYPAATPPPIQCGQACTLALDGEPVLVGWIEDVDADETGERLEFCVRGRDRAGDLVECAPLPDGPAQFSNLTLLAFTQKVCAPFGLSVRADIDVGAPFPTIVINPHETALAAIEKQARQRTALVVSDGVGGLILTRGGVRRGPAPLVRGDNLVSLRRHVSWRQRFSDIYVKGQSARGAGTRRGVGVVLDVGGAPSATPPATVAAGAQGVLMTGHARDPEINRYRPHVRLTRSQAGMSTTQEQAEWLVRVLRGEGTDLQYGVLDWRAGDAQALWRPNEVVHVSDPIAAIEGDMLVAGVRYIAGPRGLLTELRIVGLSAYDRINEAARRHRGDRVPKKKLQVIDVGGAS